MKKLSTLVFLVAFATLTASGSVKAQITHDGFTKNLDSLRHTVEDIGVVTGKIFDYVESVAALNLMPADWLPCGYECDEGWAGYQVDTSGGVQILKPCDVTTVIQYAHWYPDGIDTEKFQYRLLVFPNTCEATLWFQVPGGFSMFLKYSGGKWHWPNDRKAPMPQQAKDILNLAADTTGL